MTKLIALALITSFAAASFAQEAKEQNNGTDPTKPIRTIKVDYGYTELRNGFRADLIRARYTEPIGAGRASWSVMIPFVSTDVLGRSGYGIGDVELGYTAITQLDAKGGLVLQGSMILNTGDRIERGTGKNVLKLQVTKAFFLKDGAIFAPALVQSNSLWGESGRRDVNTTTIDFYYVPKMADPKTFVTFDPNINWDWENDKFFSALAVTVGRSIGPAFGGTSQVYLKPSILFGNDRGANWGWEIGYKVLGF